MGSKKILVVEDDEDTRLDVAEGLEGQGFSVLLASEGTGAIQHLMETPDVDTIVTDVRMPIFGGDHWLQFLEKFLVPKYRIILATARQIDKVPAGMKYLKKPYSLEELLKKLDEK
jgi:DNA-binding response OmpR family regulator